MKKIFFFLFVVILIGFIGAVFAKDLLLKVALEQAVSRLTGFDTHVGSLRYDFPSTLRVEGVEIRNPRGFESKVFTQIPEIYISLVLPELLQGKGTHLPEVRLNIQEVHIEKNSQGISNVELLSSVGGKSQQARPAKPAPQEKAESPFLLERFELTLRKVSFEDRSGLIGKAPLPKRLAVDLNVDKQVFTDIRDPQTLVNLILFKILNSATFGRLLNLDPRKLVGEDLSRTLASGKEFLNKQAVVLNEQLGNVAGQAEKAEALFQGSIGQTKGLLTDTTSAAKEKASGFLNRLKSFQLKDESSNTAQ